MPDPISVFGELVVNSPGLQHVSLSFVSWLDGPHSKCPTNCSCTVVIMLIISNEFEREYKPFWAWI